jgi:hypothetical protein
MAVLNESILAQDHLPGKLMSSAMQHMEEYNLYQQLKSHPIAPFIFASNNWYSSVY